MKYVEMGYAHTDELRQDEIAAEFRRIHRNGISHRISEISFV